MSLTYPGDANYAPMVDPYPDTVQVVVLPSLAPTTTTFTTSTTSVGPDGIITASATVTGNIPGVVPTGTIYFYGHGGLQTTLDSAGKATVVIAGYQLLPGPNEVYAQYGGDNNYAASQSAPITISSIQGDFSLTTNNATPSIASGGTTTAELSIAQLASFPQGGLTGTVNLTCTSPSPALTCALNSAAVNMPPNFAAVNTTITLTSVPGTASLSPASPLPVKSKGYFGGGAVLAAVFCLLLPTRRRKIGTLLSLIALLGVGFGATGCSNNNSPAAPAAAPSTYNVSIMANASGVQHSLVLKVTVQ